MIDEKNFKNLFEFYEKNFTKEELAKLLALKEADILSLKEKSSHTSPYDGGKDYRNHYWDHLPSFDGPITAKPNFSDLKSNNNVSYYCPPTSSWG